ncbi:MAG: hypothetical protein U1F43_09065 [Myxococcota bacterium]
MQKSLWKNHGQWQCLAHVPPITLPASAARCWMVGCSVRPSEAERPEEVIAPPEPVVLDNVKVLSVGTPNPNGEKCAYPSCNNIARDGSKYCSRTCSNRNARKRHKERRDAA